MCGNGVLLWKLKRRAKGSEMVQCAAVRRPGRGRGDAANSSCCLGTSLASQHDGELFLAQEAPVRCPLQAQESLARRYHPGAVDRVDSRRSSLSVIPVG